MKNQSLFLSGLKWFRFSYISLVMILGIAQIFCRLNAPLPRFIPSPTFSATPSPSTTSTPTLLPTLTPTFTSTPTQTLTPTALLYVEVGTPIPAVFPIIDAQSASRVSGIAMYQTPPLVDFKWHPTSSLLAAATTDSIHFIDPFQPQTPSIITLDKGLSTFDFSPDGRWLVTGHRLGDSPENFFGNVQVWIAPNYLRVAVFGDYRAVTQVQYSNDGKTVIIAYSTLSDSENVIQFRDATSWEILSTVKTGNLVSMKISPDQKTLITIPDRYSIKVWDLEKNEVRYSLPTSFSGAANCLAISPDGTRFATGHYDGSIILWDLEKGERQLSMQASGVVEGLAFNPNGEILVSGSSYQSTLIQIWSVTSGEKLRDLEGHLRGVNFLEFASSSQLLASASYDGTVRLWGIRP
ncbi:MAG: hypothetical protein N3D16_03590 [Anaerolineales bacterium]|nr:hypothetical protein [Anaerolineales bacterium]